MGEGDKASSVQHVASSNIQQMISRRSNINLSFGLMLLCLGNVYQTWTYRYITSKVTAPQDAHRRLVLQIYLGLNTLEFSSIHR